MAEANGSIILTRSLDAADQIGADLADRIAPEKLRSILTRREPPAAPPPEREIIYLRGGYALTWAPGSPPELRSRLSDMVGDAATDAITVDSDRPLRAVASMLNDPTPPPLDLPWNLKAIGITGRETQATGKGAKVAVLDSGFDFEHPDFFRRPKVGLETPGPRIPLGPKVETLPRAVNGSAQDERGHGTHTAGIVVGPLRPNDSRRYSIAPDATLLVGNVVDDQLSDWTLLKGIVEAAEAGAHAISISVGTAPTVRCPTHSMVFELVAQILLEHYQTIIVAAAGNESNRRDRRGPYIGPIVHPADCPSIIAVGAVNEDLDAALTSSGGICEQRKPTLMAPGVNIFSSFLSGNGGPKHFALTGTSQAAPHVAGAAALWFEKTGLTGKKLMDLLIASAKPLTNGKKYDRPNREFGHGLVQVPQ